MDANVALIEGLNNFLTSGIEELQYRERAQDFTRYRSIGFKKVVLLIVNMLKRSLLLELSNFFSIDGDLLQCSKSAFSHARKKLKAEFFIDWNKQLVCLYHQLYGHQVELWRGLRVLAVDGSSFHLPQTDQLACAYGLHKGHVMGRMLVCYDVLNQVGVWTTLAGTRTSENALADQLLHQWQTDDEHVLLYDRCYASFAFMQAHYEQKRHFVMRLKVNFNHVVKAFCARTRQDEVVSFTSKEKYEQDGKKQSRTVSLKVRLVRFTIDSGETVVLASSLFDEQKFSINDLKDLYSKRWGVETYFDRLKNKWQAEQFSGHTQRAVEQDFHALIFMANLQSIIAKQADPIIKEQKTACKYTYQINWNLSVGMLKDRVVRLFTSEHPEKIFEELIQLFTLDAQPVRKGRKVPRNKKFKFQTSKYKTLRNYKRAL